jgi:hypothetical protein
VLVTKQVLILLGDEEVEPVIKLAHRHCGADAQDFVTKLQRKHCGADAQDYVMLLQRKQYGVEEVEIVKQQVL